jgi:murein DD-endopeptidase MepM/ murein hydrolase activator NlpD
VKPVSDQQNTSELNAKQPENSQIATRNRKRLLSDRSLLVGLSCLVSLGMLSKGIVWAQAETPAAELTIPAEPEPVFEAVPPANPEPAPAEAAAPPEPEPETYAAPPAEIAPEPEYIAPAPEPEYIPEPPTAAAPTAPEYYLPEPELIPVPEPTAQEPEPPFEAPINPANAYIDSTDYSLGATNGYDSPTAVEFAERSTGCHTVLESGQGVGSWCGGGDSAVASGGGEDGYSSQNPIAEGGYIASPPSGANNANNNVGGGNSGSIANGNTGARNAPNIPDLPGNINGTNSNVKGNPAENIAGAVGQAVQQIGGQLWGQAAPPPPGYGQPAYSADFPDSPAADSGDRGYFASAAYYGGGGGGAFAPSMGFGPIPVAPISVTSGSSAASDYYNPVRPVGLPGNGNTSLLFPLSIAAAITSPFGWRVHPVLGYGRFHTGTDLGAPMGTPVLAAYAGQVAIADWLGGYGLTVVLNHSQKSQETLYAHLSELFVKPGEFVKQGETIGRVGSSGMSTGPHLHFEIRQMTDRGWVAIDPGSQLEFGLAKMLGTLQTAKIPEMPKILPAPSGNSLKDLENDLPQLPPLPVGMDIEVVNLQPPFPELLKTDTSKPKSNEVAKPKTQKQASR